MVSLINSLRRHVRLQTYKKDVDEVFLKLNDSLNPFLSPPYYEILQLANACLKVAEDVNEIRPDIILASFREGYVIYRLSFGALRLTLKIPVSDYNPLVVHPFLNDNTVGVGLKEGHPKTEDAIDELQRIRRTGTYRKGMIVDRCTTGAQLASLFNNYSRHLEDIATEFYASVVYDTFGYPALLEERVRSGYVRVHPGPQFSIFHEETHPNPFLGLRYIGEGKNHVFPSSTSFGVQYEWKHVLGLIEGLYRDWHILTRY